MVRNVQVKTPIFFNFSLAKYSPLSGERRELNIEISVSKPKKFEAKYNNKKRYRVEYFCQILTALISYASRKYKLCYLSNDTKKAASVNQMFSAKVLDRNYFLWLTTRAREPGLNLRVCHKDFYHNHILIMSDDEDDDDDDNDNDAEADDIIL